MASSGNFGTWNPLNIGSGGSTSLTVGNTNAVMTGADPRTTGTVGGVISDTDGYYFETVATSTGSGALTLGIINEDRHNKCMYEQIHSRSGSFMWRGYSSGQFFVETSTNTSYGTFADGDIIGWFVKNSKLYVKKNNSDVVGDVVNTSAGIDISGGFFFPAVSRTVGGGAQTSSILRTDSGDWSYSPPDGFKGLTSKDMLISSDIDPAQTDDDYAGGKQFNVINYTGNASTNAITGLGFKPDLVWIQNNGSQNQTARIQDSSRGVTKSFEPAYTTNESTESGVTAFGTDGFTLGSQQGGYNSSGASYIAWCWRANGGTTATNSDGDSNTTVQANTAAGFSIVEWPSYSGDTKFGHGLTKTPNFIIAKLISGGSNWPTYHDGYSSGKACFVNKSDAEANSTHFAHSGTGNPVSATTFGMGASFAGSGAGIAYVWHDVEGFSKFASFEGNGNSDGPFIYTGFRPRFIFIKRIDSGGSWHVFDTTRNIFNPVNTYMLWDSDGGDDTAASNSIDFLSNGFKLRNTAAGLNGSGNDYVYGAWGDVPFKYNNTF